MIFFLQKKIYQSVIIIGLMVRFILPTTAFAEESHSRILIDQAGRSVKVPDNPIRVVALALASPKSFMHYIVRTV